jgi:hypothetical protein
VWREGGTVLGLNFWFETGTPTFLIKLMRRDGLYDVSRLEISGHSFISYDI